MPWGWVDISLSITSVGPSSFNLPDVPRQARRIYARNKQNRIHRGGSALHNSSRFTLWRAAEKGSLSARLLPLTSLFYCTPSIDNQRVPGKKLCVHEVGNSISDVGWLARALKRSEERRVGKS